MELCNALRRDALQVIRESEIDFSGFDGKKIMITGATGLLGLNLAAVFLVYGEMSQNPPEVLAVIRSREKAEKLYKGLDTSAVRWILADVTEFPQDAEKADYVIHAASVTSSRAFVEQPAETIRTALNGTECMLKYAAAARAESFVYLSSMEVYGSPQTDEKIREDHGTNLNTMETRTSYPESKRMCESLCRAYAAEYGVPAKVVRLTQTFGPGVFYRDGRVFAEFMRCVKEKRDIVLHTKGETKRVYLYTADAVSAILTVLLNGKTGEAYNASNDNTYCSICEMAELAASLDETGTVRVRIEEEDNESRGYAPVLHMNLDTKKLRSLGWRARTDLRNMFVRLSETMDPEA
ncbi:MAG: NAD(P)-dependent oxidoreductase [Lachnospiraceae bacterium]|nr:NAD(P)-dependent oxidoreductase [Lachnospiraceae bacterium]